MALYSMCNFSRNIEVFCICLINTNTKKPAMSSKEERFWRVGQDSFKYDFASKIFHKLLLNIHSNHENSLKLLLYEHMHMH